MIHLFTGAIGSGKTLSALNFIAKHKNYSQRPLYVYGVNDFNTQAYTDLTGIECHKITLEQLQNWRDEVPSNSVILIDEVQKVWRKQKTGVAPPKAVQDLETSRWAGYDFVATCQFTTQLDVDFRKHCNDHFHLERKKGLQRVVVYNWETVQNTPPDYHQKLECTKTAFRIKEMEPYFSVYHSADSHNITP